MEKNSDFVIPQELFKKYFDIDDETHILKHPRNSQIIEEVKSKKITLKAMMRSDGRYATILFAFRDKNGEIKSFPEESVDIFDGYDFSEVDKVAPSYFNKFYLTDGFNLITDPEMTNDFIKNMSSSELSNEDFYNNFIKTYQYPFMSPRCNNDFTDKFTCGTEQRSGIEPKPFNISYGKICDKNGNDIKLKREYCDNNNKLIASYYLLRKDGDKYSLYDDKQHKILDNIQCHRDIVRFNNIKDRAIYFMTNDKSAMAYLNFNWDLCRMKDIQYDQKVNIVSFIAKITINDCNQNLDVIRSTHKDSINEIKNTITRITENLNNIEKSIPKNFEKIKSDLAKFNNNDLIDRRIISLKSNINQIEMLTEKFRDDSDSKLNQAMIEINGKFRMQDQNSNFFFYMSMIVLIAIVLFK